MTEPDILKAEKFGDLRFGCGEEHICFGCGKTIVFEENVYTFDRFGRIFCCDVCRLEELQ